MKFYKIIFLLILMCLSSSCISDKKTQFNATLSVSHALGSGKEEGFARAVNIYKFSFPKDHGPHSKYRNEWWYYTGNLDGPAGQHFGFQLTFFKIALSPKQIKRKNPWATENIYMAHFALSDIKNNHFYAYDRFSRDGLKLAGAKSEPFCVWLEDWSVKGSGQDGLPMIIKAFEEDVSINLILSGNKPVVLQGIKGLSQKGPEKGNASYYYSLTRMATEGTIKVKDKSFSVKGLTWMDREWSTSSLDKDQTGWDWFALQLSDGREVMYYQIRKNDGRADPLSNGTIIYNDGKTRHLTIKDVNLEVLSEWTSPDGKVTYPASWRLRISDEKIDLNITPHMANQELNVTVRYWEGAVKTEGMSNGKEVTGNGYVELTGYDMGLKSN